MRVAPAESLLTWLTKLTGPHLVEVVSTSESHTALAILVTPEVLYDPYSPRVWLGLVYKAPYIKTASFSEAFFYLKSASEAEADKRITDSHLMFVQINEASKVIPLPGVQPLFLDVPTTSDIMDSNKPKSPCAFRPFRLHRVIYMEGSTPTTQVAFPRLRGKTKSHLLNANSFLLVLAVSGPFTSFLVLHTISWFSRSEVCAFVWGIFVRGLRVETFVRVLRSSRVVL